MAKRERRFDLCTATALAALMLPAIGAAAEDVALRPRYQVGDRYALALSTETETHADAHGVRRDSFNEDVELRYAAQVEVLETDAAGFPRANGTRASRSAM